MRIYIDSSAIIKRGIEEAGSEALEQALERYSGEEHSMLSSSLAWIEVSRALRSRLDDEAPAEISALAEDVLSGILEAPVGAPVVALARRLGPSSLRSLDVIHLATALILDADLVIGYDARLLAAAGELGLQTLSPV